MRRLVLLLLALSACGTRIPDVCADFADKTCVALIVDTESGVAADQIGVLSNDLAILAAEQRTPSTPTKLSFPVVTAVVLGSGAPPASFTLHARGYSAQGAVVAVEENPAVVTNLMAGDHATAKITLRAGTSDLGVPDDGDMAMPAPDMDMAMPTDPMPMPVDMDMTMPSDPMPTHMDMGVCLFDTDKFDNCTFGP